METNITTYSVFLKNTNYQIHLMDVFPSTRNLVSIFLLLLLTLHSVLAADFKKGLAAARKGDFETAMKEWRPLAEQGDSYAQYNLGLMYDKGDGVVEDDTQAVYWYRKSAEQGNAQGQHSLGLMYDYGLGVIEDDTQAVYWFRKAAEQGEEKK